MKALVLAMHTGQAPMMIAGVDAVPTPANPFLNGIIFHTVLNLMQLNYHGASAIYRRWRLRIGINSRMWAVHTDPISSAGTVACPRVQARQLHSVAEDVVAE